MRNLHRPFENLRTEMPKAARLIQLGWIHRSHKKSTQVRKNNGGGTRKTDISKSALKSEIMEDEVIMEEHRLEVIDRTSILTCWIYSDRPVGDDVTVSDMYEKTKMPLLRFYLSSIPKINSEDLA